MASTVVCPFVELDNEFPSVLFVLHHAPSGRYGCYCHDGVNGLAVFSHEGGALRFAEWIDLTGMVIHEVTFDEARDIAKGRPLPIVCMMLLDNLESPAIHYIR
ncbi:MAG: hypothetical protein KF812_02570 [Fimbriimonadaceae bacterium]|nr:hypothetical protein [Fimbriimonadaceae bacterium]